MRVAVVALGILAATAPAAADTYFVATTGSDRGDGSAARPWKSLQRAADHDLRAGDVVVVRPGRYAGFDFRGSGSADAPIRFLADRDVTVSGRNENTPDGINLEGVRHVHIENFTITGAPRAGIRAVDCQDVVIRNNRARDNGRWGVFTGFCDDLVVEHNELSGSDDEHGVYHSNSADRPTIRNNLIFGNSKNGIHLNGDASMGGDGVISNALIEGNVIYGNGQRGGGAINADGLHDSVIRNNLIYDNHASGITLYKIDGKTGPRGNVVANNTIVMPADKTRFALLVRAASGQNVAVNNILVNLHRRKGSITLFPDSRPEHIRSDYNVVVDRFTVNDERSLMDLAAWREHTGNDAHSILAGPDDLFVDWRAGDFRPAPASPAVDRGTLEHAHATDIAGNPRPTGDGVDIGAFERCDGDACQSPRPGPLPDAAEAAAAAIRAAGAQASTDAPPAAAAPGKKGCSGCGAGGAGGTQWLAMAMAMVMGVVARRRRRRA